MWKGLGQLGHRLLALALCLACAPLSASPPEQKVSLWSLKKVGRPEPPAVKDAAWPLTPIDRFVLARLEEKGLVPSPDAGKEDLLRRVTLDLTGLLPEPDEVDSFAADSSPEAYERVVDRLLASPRYGERWARHWLDLARYAESEGFKSDELRPNAWRYRDYVIESLNADKPYDRFIREQIAGDELWPDDPTAHIATGFNRHYPDESNARDLMQRRQEILNDITDVVGQVFTGLTFGCARCHDHKYDPITQADYYRFQAFFANVRAVDDAPAVTRDVLARHGEKLAVWEEKTREIRAEMASIEEPKRKSIAKDNFDKFPPEIQTAITKAAAERTPIEWQMYYKAQPYMNPDRDAVTGALQGDAKKRWQALDGELKKFADIYPGDLPISTGIADAGREAPKTHVLAVGVFNAPREEVEPGFPSAVTSTPPRLETPAGIESSGRRSALASWLASPENPLTTRVIVNRIWHYHFGRGIAATPDDLGVMGERPTHPELLDWLASELVEGDWSLKRIHRLIVTSRVYRQTALDRADGLEKDPENKLCWRFPTLRLEGEAIRDVSLQASGILNLEMGGPSVMPELPEGMGAGGYSKWDTTKDAAERNRRSVYVFVKRNLRYPLFQAFDMPDTHEPCGRRNVTTIAPQALMLMNGELAVSWARAFARRVRDAAGTDARAQVERAYRIAYSRHPAKDEVESALAFLERERKLRADGDGKGSDPASTALEDFCHVLLNSNEFVYRS